MVSLYWLYQPHVFHFLGCWLLLSPAAQKSQSYFQFPRHFHWDLCTQNSVNSFFILQNDSQSVKESSESPIGWTPRIQLDELGFSQSYLQISDSQKLAQFAAEGQMCRT